MSKFDNMDDDLLWSVLQNLSHRDISNLADEDERVNEFYQTKGFWERIYRRDYGEIPTGTVSVRDLYLKENGYVYEIDRPHFLAIAATDFPLL